MVDKTRFDGITGKGFEGIGPRQREIYDYIKHKGSVPYKQIVKDKGSVSPFSRGHPAYTGPRITHMGFDELLKKLKVRGLITSKDGVYTIVTTGDSSNTTIVGVSKGLVDRYKNLKTVRSPHFLRCIKCKATYPAGSSVGVLKSETSGVYLCPVDGAQLTVG